MAADNDVTRLQAEHHGLVPTEGFRTLEEFCLYLIHRRAYEEAAALADGKAVLDCGCNVGYGTEIIRPRCRRIVGVDVSPKAIEQARRLHAAGGADFRVVDGRTLPFADGEFDLAVSFQVIEHVADRRAYLAELRRVLGPAGTLLLTTPNAALRIEPGMKPWNPFHVKEFRPQELRQELTEVFPHVQVRGLFAAEALYAVEAGRVRAARSAALRRPAWLNALSARLRTSLPPWALSAIRRTMRALHGRGGLPPPGTFEQYSTADLFYRDECVEKALDLMAICRKGGASNVPKHL